MMSGFTDWIKRSPLVAFFVLVFGVEWLLFLALRSFVPPPVNVFISWVFNHTGGSLIAAFLCHLAFNFVGNVTGVSSGLPALFWLLVVIWWAVAIAIVALDWAHLSRPAGASAQGAGAVS